MPPSASLIIGGGRTVTALFDGVFERNRLIENAFIEAALRALTMEMRQRRQHGPW